MGNLIIFIPIGLLMIFLGYRIWKKEQITLIHYYHHMKVSEKDKKSYTEKMGKSITIIGVGVVLTGIIDFISNTAYGLFCFGIFFVWGFALQFKAQKKYNGGFFS